MKREETNACCVARRSFGEDIDRLGMVFDVEAWVDCTVGMVVLGIPGMG